ncbi:uncharacterized protein PRCAT00001609001 [Priceomyces carsonii]|uniref:uncharacterized protein n=1 Tax=Priceomyces carsonii TaxID=28549 RepID=UPI002EDB97D6|nr:unnamed protein product [Priceomyces carsonii]
MTLMERASLMDWKIEIITSSTIVLFAILYKVGDYYNKHLVTKFLNSLRDEFEKNFYQYGVTKDELYIKDSPENYTSYATGRLNIANVTLRFKLVPRHNLFVWIIEYVMSYFTESVQSPEDNVEITIVPSNAAIYDNFICAIVSKLGMNVQRKNNYFLSLTRTADSATIPESFVFMSEATELQEKILTGKLKRALTLESASYIKFLALTDQSTEKPSTTSGFSPRRRIIFSLKVVSDSEKLKQVLDLIEALLLLVDKLASKDITILNGTLKKVVKTRENEIEKLKKAEQQLEEERLASEKAKASREERDKLRSLPAAERIKLEKKALEKKQKKQQKKQRVRM